MSGRRRVESKHRRSGQKNRHGKGGLERSVASGAAGRTVGRGLSWMLTGEWVSYLLQVGTTMVLARLLTPQIFGVMAMALTLTVIVDQVRNLGLSQAVIQRDDLTWTQVNGLFWINLAMGALLAAVVAGTGPLLAVFYDEPQLVSLCMILGLGYVLSGLSVQHSALLNRRMDFRTISVRNMIGRVLSSAAAIGAAVAGLGVWSLVVQQLSLVLFTTLFIWMAVPWRPSRPRHLADAAPLVKFGSLISASNLFYSIARQADNVVIGRVLGADSLGLYTRAYGLLTLPLRQLRAPVGSVMVPMLSALQSEPLRYRRAYCRAISGLAHLGMPIVVVLAVEAAEVIDVFLGSQWAAAAPIFQLLAIASIVQLVSTTAGWLFVSLGRGGTAASWALFSTTATVASFVVGVRWGVEGVAAAYVISQAVLTGPAFVIACRGTPVSVLDVLIAVLRPVAVSAVVLGAAVGIRGVAPDQWPSLIHLVAVATTAVVTWGMVMLAWRRARDEVTDLVSTVRSKKGRS